MSASDDGTGVTRRDTLRAGAVAVTGSAAIAGTGTVTADDDEDSSWWDSAITNTADRLVDIAEFGYLFATGRAFHHIVGDDRDYSDYIGADRLHAEIHYGALSMEIADETTLTSLENNIEYSSNVALPKAKKALVEAFNEGKSEEEAHDEMMEAIDDYYARLQENLLNSYEAQLTQVQHHFWQLHEHEDINLEDQEQMEAHYHQDDDPSATRENTTALYHLVEEGANEYYDGSRSDSDDTEYYPYELADGTTREVYTNQYSWYNSSAENSHVAWIAPALHDNIADVYQDDFNEDDEGYIDDRPTYATRFVVSPMDEDDAEELQDDIDDPEIAEEEELSLTDQTFYFDCWRYHEAWEAIIDEHGAVVSNMTQFASDVYDYYEPGEIDAAEFIDPITAYSEMNADYEDTGYYGYAGAALANAGVPMSDGQLTVELLEDEKTVDAQIYATDWPEDGFDVGETVDPSDHDGQIYLSMNVVVETDDGVEEQAELTQVKQEFEIIEAVDGDGGEVTVVDGGSRNYQTSDVESLIDELDQTNQLLNEMQAQADEDGDGDDSDSLFGGLFDGSGTSVPGLSAIIAAAAVLYALTQGN